MIRDIDHLASNARNASNASNATNASNASNVSHISNASNAKNASNASNSSNTSNTSDASNSSKTSTSVSRLSSFLSCSLLNKYLYPFQCFFFSRVGMYEFLYMRGSNSSFSLLKCIWECLISRMSFIKTRRRGKQKCHNIGKPKTRFLKQGGADFKIVKRF